jgi:hypothetical protein
MNDLDVNRFGRLHDDGRRLIKGWMRHAKQRMSKGDGGCFEAFIFCWIAFNGWYSCVTGDDTDFVALGKLSDSTKLKDLFQAMREEDAGFARATKAFKDKWPVVDVQKLRKLTEKIEGPGDNKLAWARMHSDLLYELRVSPRLNDNPRWEQEGFEETWKNTVWALYKVRCNLFHGDKAASSENDRTMVASALAVLFPFFGRLLDDTISMQSANNLEE